MSDTNAAPEVAITRETGSGGHALLRFVGPFRPFQMGYTKLKTILDHQDDVRSFLHDVEQERAAEKAEQAAKEAEERRKAEAAERAKNDPTTQAIIKGLESGTISREDLLSVLQESVAQANNIKIPAQPTSPDAKPLPDPTDKVGLVIELAKICDQYSYNSIGKKIGVGGTTVKAWCRALNDDTKKNAWWPNEERLQDIYLFLQMWQERDPSIIVGLTKVGGNRGWKNDE